MRQNEENVKKILQELNINARQKYSEISEKTGIHKNTVRAVIHRLEKEGIIWTYKPVIDYRKLGFQAYVLLIKENKVPSSFHGDKDRLKESLKVTHDIMGEDDCFVLHSGLIHGNFGAYVYFVARDLVTARNCVEKFIIRMDSNIIDYELLPELKLVRIGGTLNPELEP